jgi:hypothetical protein
MPSTLDENLGTNTTIHTGSENRFNGKHMSPIPEALQGLNRAKRKFERDTERMSFIITWRAWKDLFQEKENKKKELAKLKIKKEREEKKRSDKGHNR